jgi:hypothetical protein
MICGGVEPLCMLYSSGLYIVEAVVRTVLSQRCLKDRDRPDPNFAPPVLQRHRDESRTLSERICSSFKRRNNNGYNASSTPSLIIFVLKAKHRFSRVYLPNTASIFKERRSLHLW